MSTLRRWKLLLRSVRSYGRMDCLWVESTLFYLDVIMPAFAP